MLLQGDTTLHELTNRSRTSQTCGHPTKNGPCGHRVIGDGLCAAEVRPKVFCALESC